MDTRKQIGREQFIAEIDRRYPEDMPREGNSFSDRGRRKCWYNAMALRRRLDAGGQPTVREVVGYFGAGARFVE